MEQHSGHDASCQRLRAGQFRRYRTFGWLMRSRCFRVEQTSILRRSTKAPKHDLEPSSSSRLRFCVARRKSPKHDLELLFASDELRGHVARAYLSRSPRDFAMKEKTPPRIGTCFLLALAGSGPVLSCGDYGDLP